MSDSGEVLESEVVVDWELGSDVFCHWHRVIRVRRYEPISEKTLCQIKIMTSDLCNVMSTRKIPPDLEVEETSYQQQ